jgi:peptidoglycan/xylan/chitin deacetylase (PgdA/CDA1 family)
MFESIVDAIQPLRDRARITFDDGNQSDLEIALPILRRKGIPARFFVVSDRIDQPGYLSSDGIRMLAADGMSIGSHGKQHVRWTGLPRPHLDEDIGESLARLREVVGGPMDEVAVPFGAYDRSVLHALKSHRVSHVFTSDRGLASDSAWLVPRNTVRVDSDVGAIRDAIENGIPLGTRLRTAAGRLKRQLL